MGRVTEFGFDGQNRETSRTLPLGTATATVGDFEEAKTYFDDPADGARYGLLASSTDAEGNTTQYEHDGFGRVWRTVTTGPGDGNARTITTRFDGLGRVKSVTDSVVGATSHTYDAEGRLKIRATPQGTLVYGYDAATGRKTSVDTVTTRVEYGHDRLGRLKTVTEKLRDGVAVDATTTYVYNPGGELEQKTAPGGVTTSYTYDSLGRLRSLEVQDGSGELVFSQTGIRYDRAGNRTGLTEMTSAPGRAVDIVASMEWTYDGLNRLVREYRGTSNYTQVGLRYTDTFTYDLNSNRVSSTHVAPRTPAENESVVYAYDANDRLLSEDSTLDENDKTFIYDLNGSLLTETVGTEVTSYDWDAMNRLVGVDKDGIPGYEITYTYDANGVRVTQTVDGVTTTYLHDGSNPTGYSKPIEEKIDGLIDRSYVVGLVVESQFDAHLDQSVVLSHDAHGSTRAILDAVTAEVVQRLAYDAFGETLAGTALTEADAALTTWLFAGDGSRDVATGLTYHLERWRSGNVFVSTDPYRGSVSNPLTLHHRGYVHQSPIVGVDPSGLFFSKIEQALVRGLSAGLVSLQAPALAGSVTATRLLLTGIQLSRLHPIATAAGGIVVSSFVPEGVEDALIGVPGFGRLAPQVSVSRQVRRGAFDALTVKVSEIVNFAIGRSRIMKRADELQAAGGLPSLETIRPLEGLGGARFEAVTGLTLSPGPRGGADFILANGRRLELKGPLPLNAGRASDSGVDGLIRAAVMDLEGDFGADEVLIDALGFSPVQLGRLQEALAGANNRTGKIIRIIQ